MSTGPWDSALEKLRSWESSWAAICATMTENPWESGILPRRFVELVGVALNAACTNLNPEGTRRHIRAALAAGATRDEILMILKMASVMAIHSCSLGAPILIQVLALLYSRSNLSDVLPPSANVTISNVPGPRQTLYAVGAELLHIFPVSIATHGLALNITVQSYRDQLDFGFIAGANIIPHVEVLANMLPKEFELLAAAVAPGNRASAAS